MIVVGVEVTTLRHIETEWGLVVIAGQEIVRIVGETGRHGGGLGKFWWPDTEVSSLGLVDSFVWWPDSIMDHTLAIIPLLEEVTTMLLMRRMNAGQVLHSGSKFILLETLINQKIVLLMHGSVATLARASEDFESSSQSILQIQKVKP